MKFVILLLCIACAYATNSYFTGVCPDNHANGDRWNPPNTCTECYCDHNGYGCQGCDKVTPIIGCYEVAVDKTLNYPECCPRLECPPFIPPDN